jgi:type VI secretion system protein ImpM
MSTEPLTVAGYHGKAPAFGDFVSRGLPHAFIGPWDIWLQEAIHTSRLQLGDNWLNYYLTSPLYRFVLTPGICDDSAWMGVMMPSVDKVGRYYPMTIGLKCLETTNPFTALQNNGQWFEHAEALALSCLNDNFDVDYFYQQICQLTPSVEFLPHNNADQPKHQNELIFPGNYRHPLSSVEAMPELLPSILDIMLKEHAFAYSVWWTHGSEHVSPSLLLCTGLPPFDGIAAMFDGNWPQWGWEGNRHPIHT